MQPIDEEARQVVVVQISPLTIHTQSETERHLRSFPRNSQRLFPCFESTQGYNRMFSRISTSELPPIMYTSLERTDKYFGCLCTVEGEGNKEGHVIEVDYSESEYCVLFGQHLPFNRSGGWNPPYYHATGTKYDMIWTTKENIHILEQDPVKERQLGEFPKRTIKLRVGAKYGKPMKELFDKGDVAFAYDTIRMNTVEGNWLMSHYRRYSPLAYSRLLDRYQSGDEYDGVWDQMWSSRCRFHIHKWYTHFNFSQYMWKRVMHTFEHELVNVRLCEGGTYEYDLSVSYMGFFATDITQHIFIPNASATSNAMIAIRKVMVSLYPELNFYHRNIPSMFSYDSVTRELSSKLTKQSLVNLPTPKISCLKPYQNYLVCNMIRRENSLHHTSNIFNKIFDKFVFNAIIGFNRGSSGHSNGGIVSLGMGLGKTTIIIELIRRKRSKTLIVVPRVIIDQWILEFKLNAPELSVTEYYRSKKLTNADVVITTYGMMQNCPPDLLSHATFDRVVFDESHTLKGINSLSISCCIAMPAKNRWCLSATPHDKLPHHFALLRIDPFLYNRSERILQFMLSQARDHLYFLLRHIIFAVDVQQLDLLEMNPLHTIVETCQSVKLDLNPQEAKIISYMINNHEQRFRAFEELHGYYPANELKRVIERINVASIDHTLLPLSSFSMLIKGIRGINEMTVDDVIKTLDSSTTSTEAFRKAIKEKLKAKSQDESCPICLEPFTTEVLTPCFHSFCEECLVQCLNTKTTCPTCRKPCCTTDIIRLADTVVNQNVDGMFTFTDGFSSKYEISSEMKLIYDNKIISSKFIWIEENIKSFQIKNESTVIFASRDVFLKRLQQYLVSKNIKVCVIDGRASRAQIKVAIKTFNDMSANVFLLSSKAAAIGINLTTASNVIFIDPFIDDITKKQSIGRLKRIGQNKNIQVFDLTFKTGIESMHVKNISERVTFQHALQWAHNITTV
jgi:superfamily II DNA or RNA helicase